MSTAPTLRQLLEQGLVLAPGIYNAMGARLVEQTGFAAVYVSGFGTAARYGYADVGLVTQTEMVDNLRYICRATTLPVIADADTGYGNPINVQRTVHEYERAGAAALHLEDQVFPKKCGFMAGKLVVPVDEAAQKIRAAVAARRDASFVIIARTDALAVEGWESVIVRCHAFRDAGADLVFVDGIRTLDELTIYSERLALQGLPCLYNGGLVSAADADQLGFKVQIIAGLALNALYRASSESMRALRDSGSMAAVYEQYGGAAEGATMDHLLGLDDVYEQERRYGISANGGVGVDAGVGSGS